MLKVPSLDVTDWLGAVTHLLAEPARAAGVVAAQQAALDERHRASGVARAYEELYLELAR